jgi:hypothetical protein
MKNRFVASVALAAGLGLPVVTVHADTLFTVPVSGTLQPQRLSTELQQDSGASFNSDNTSRFASISYDWNRYFSIGTVARLNDGFSMRPTGSVQFAPMQSRYSFALGVANVGVRTFRSQPYAVASTSFKSLGGLSAYAGVTHDTFGNHVMLGTDYSLSHHVSLQADWIGDDGNFFTVGARWEVIPDFAVAGGFMRANSHDNGNGAFLSLEKDFRFK